MSNNTRTAFRRPNTSAPSDGSRTLTITTAPPSEDEGGSSNEPSASGTLKLRGSTRKPRQRVLWRDDVVDNEGAGKKSSKICCIYHKPKAFDESSDEDDSSDEDSDSSHRAHEHEHRHTHEHRAQAGSVHHAHDTGATIEHIEHADPSKNAYELAPQKGKHKAS